MQAAAQQLKRWFADPVDSILAQAPRALIASIFAAAVDVGIFLFLVRFAGTHPVGAAVVGYLSGGVLQYVLCSYWVFGNANAPSNAAMGFLAFTVLSLLGLGITCAVIAVLHDWAHVHYTFAKVVALGLTFAWNFLSRKFLLFGGSVSAE